MEQDVKATRGPLLVVVALAAPMLVAAPAIAADAAAAQALAQQNKCFSCHSVEKDKGGPAWKAVAAKYKGNKDAVAILTKHLETGPKVKMGTMEVEHPIIKANSPADTKNLVEWLLSL